MVNDESYRIALITILSSRRSRPNSRDRQGDCAMVGSLERWRHAETGEPQRLCASFAYAAKSWDRVRRVIVKAEHNAQGANPRFIVSNDPRALYDDVYCQRGEMENRIKEQQLDLSPTGRAAIASRRTSSDRC
jgi:hypothetical protein